MTEQSTAVAQTPSLGDAIEDDEPGIASLDDVYLDSTLVLVGCGKAKRDPDDPVDLHEAAVGPDEEIRKHGPSGPAWEAHDLYTSTYFGSKRDFAETVTAWAQSRDSSAWGILSAEHGVLMPWETVKPYDTTIDDLGDDPTNEDHWANTWDGRRRPDGERVVTEMDHWAANVAVGLSRWLASFREDGANPWENDANSLLVLAGESYVKPLRDRGVFKYGIGRMAGDPNQFHELPVDVRFLFDEIDAGGIGEQMAWLSDAVDRLEVTLDESEQNELSAWTGHDRECATCGATGRETDLTDYDGVAYCENHQPAGRCSRCDEWTHETGLGSYPLCPDCQTDRGGQKRQPLNPETTEQMSVIPTPDGGEGRGE